MATSIPQAWHVRHGAWYLVDQLANRSRNQHQALVRAHDTACLNKLARSCFTFLDRLHSHAQALSAAPPTPRDTQNVITASLVGRAMVSPTHFKNALRSRQNRASVTALPEALSTVYPSAVTSTLRFLYSRNDCRGSTPVGAIDTAMYVATASNHTSV